MTLLPVNFLELAKKVGGSRVMMNIVALGVSFGLLAYDHMVPQHLIAQTFGRKGDEIVNLNKDAFMEGYNLGKQHHEKFSRRIRQFRMIKC